ncbi:MAG: hypothetical protein R2724_27170 [Bryobacterales bacterium]
MWESAKTAWKLAMGFAACTMAAASAPRADVGRGQQVERGQSERGEDGVDVEARVTAGSGPDSADEDGQAGGVAADEAAVGLLEPVHAQMLRGRSGAEGEAAFLEDEARLGVVAVGVGRGVGRAYVVGEQQEVAAGEQGEQGHGRLRLRRRPMR